MDQLSWRALTADWDGNDEQQPLSQCSYFAGPGRHRMSATWQPGCKWRPNDRLGAWVLAMKKNIRLKFYMIF